MVEFKKGKRSKLQIEWDKKITELYDWFNKKKMSIYDELGFLEFARSGILMSMVDYRIKEREKKDG